MPQFPTNKMYRTTSLLILSLATLFVSLGSAIPATISASGNARFETNSHDHVRRQLLNDLFNNLPGNLQDDLTQGILQNWWSAIPRDEAAIRKAFGVNDLNSLNAPVEFLNIPGYANYSATGKNWNLRVRGQLHTEPYFKLPQSTQDSLAKAFVPDVNWNQLSPQEQNNARNLTGAIFGVPKQGEQLRFQFKWARESPGRPSNGWEQQTTFPDRTNTVGEIEGFVPLQGNGLPDGNVQGGVVGVVDIWTQGISTGNATGYLVPEQGITILSDIDDVLRVTKIYKPEEGVVNTFARDFTPWLNMPSIYAAWSASSTPTSSNATTPGSPYHFHYLTTTPTQATRRYMNFIYNNYPLGSFDTRPLLFKSVSETFASRSVLLHRIFETFPKRRFVLVGDITNSDVLKDYPQLASDFPGQVHCILMRNVTATDPENRLPYNLDGFKNLKREMYMFFNTPSDLAGLDFYRGDCLNSSVTQYVGGGYGYGWRNLPGNGVLGNGARKRMPVGRYAIFVVSLVINFLLW